jgi:ferrous iron transport protein A
MPLAMVSPGEKKIINEFRVDDKMRKHLNDLGFIKGEQIDVVDQGSTGIILIVKGVRLALNRGLAQRIIVS